MKPRFADYDLVLDLQSESLSDRGSAFNVLLFKGSTQNSPAYTK